MPYERWIEKNIEEVLRNPEEMEYFKRTDGDFKKLVRELIGYTKQDRDQRLKQRAHAGLNFIISGGIKDVNVNDILQQAVLESGYSVVELVDGYIATARQEKDSRAALTARDRLGMIMGAKGFQKDGGKEDHSRVGNKTQVNIFIGKDENLEESEKRINELGRFLPNVQTATE